MPFTIQRNLITSLPSKRSPLELGLVSFNSVHPQFKIFTRAQRPLLSNESLKTKSENPENQHVLLHSHSKHEWIPGHVHNHAFIPAHSHNVFIPSHSILLTKSVHSIILPYRNHYGGFGIGINAGGPGAGHGYQVVF